MLKYINTLMLSTLKENAKEFLDSGNDNLKKERNNAAISDFFKTTVILADYKIYEQLKILPKNHNHRFELLEKYFPKIYSKTSNLFKKYRDSYNNKTSKEDAIKVKEYAEQLLKTIN